MFANAPVVTERYRLNQRKTSGMAAFSFKEKRTCGHLKVGFHQA
jgi:hypothetical protein